MKQRRFPINIPNCLTVLRIILTPLFVIFMLKQMFGYAFLVFALAGITDGLDGYIAKTYDQRTVLGAFLDPIADKLLLSSAYLSLAFLDRAPSWIAVIVVSREIAIALGVSIFGIFNIRFEIQPSLISKLTTVCQIVTVMVYLIDPSLVPLDRFKPALIWSTAILTIASGLHYMYKGLAILQEALEDS